MSYKNFIEITKPGMVAGNLIPAIGGFLLASRGNVDGGLFALMIIGLALVIASACAYNNVIDRGIDAKMERTKARAVATGEVPVSYALAVASLLLVVGFAVLILHTTWAAVGAAALGFFAYVFLYSLWAKRTTDWGTAVGAIAGATPPVVGYAAVTGRIDAAAVILFAIMIVWQMPHFFAIAIRRKNDYAAAGVPVLSVTKGVRVTKRQMLAYVAAFALIAPLLTVFGYTGVAYLFVSLVLAIVWLAKAYKGLAIPDDAKETIAWAREMFLFSLVVMLVLFATISLTGFI